MIISEASTKLLATTLVLCFTACDGFTTIKGKVTDQSGKPIQDATVIMETGSGARKDEDKSKEDGSFTVHLSHAPFNVKLTLTISKQGYKTFKKRFRKSEAGEYSKDIALEPEPKEKGE
jgi:hypothetical protein